MKSEIIYCTNQTHNKLLKGLCQYCKSLALVLNFKFSGKWNEVVFSKSGSSTVISHFAVGHDGTHALLGMFSITKKDTNRKLTLYILLWTLDPDGLVAPGIRIFGMLCYSPFASLFCTLFSFRCRIGRDPDQ